MSYSNVPTGGSCTPTLYRVTVTDPNGLQEVRNFDDDTDIWTTISSDSGNFGALLHTGVRALTFVESSFATPYTPYFGTYTIVIETYRPSTGLIETQGKFTKTYEIVKNCPAVAFPTPAALLATALTNIAVGTTNTVDASMLSFPFVLNID